MHVLCASMHATRCDVLACRMMEFARCLTCAHTHMHARGYRSGQAPCDMPAHMQAGGYQQLRLRLLSRRDKSRCCIHKLHAAAGAEEAFASDGLGAAQCGSSWAAEGAGQNHAGPYASQEQQQAQAQGAAGASMNAAAERALAPAPDAVASLSQRQQLRALLQQAGEGLLRERSGGAHACVHARVVVEVLADFEGKRGEAGVEGGASQGALVSVPYMQSKRVPAHVLSPPPMATAPAPA